MVCNGRKTRSSKYILCTHLRALVQRSSLFLSASLNVPLFAKRSSVSLATQTRILIPSLSKRRISRARVLLLSESFLSLAARIMPGKLLVAKQRPVYISTRHRRVYQKVEEREKRATLSQRSAARGRKREVYARRADDSGGPRSE